MSQNDLYKFLYILFLKHPEENGMSYFQHFFRALGMSCKMFFGSIVLIIHAFYPYFFEKTGSDLIKSLYMSYIYHSHNKDHDKDKKSD